MGEEQVRSSKVTPGSRSGQVWLGLVGSGQEWWEKKNLGNGINNFLTYMDHVHTRQGLVATLPARTNPPFFLFLFQG
jgi:hypothetical protein